MVAGSFFAALKNDPATALPIPPVNTHAATVRHIELRYKVKRLRSGLDYTTPHGVRDEYFNQLEAA